MVRDVAMLVRRAQHRERDLERGHRPRSAVQRRRAVDDRGIELVDHLGARHRGRRQRIEPDAAVLVDQHAVRLRP
jgi:hypothetical protein